MLRRGAEAFLLGLVACSSAAEPVVSAPDVDQPPPPGIFTTNSTSYTAAVDSNLSLTRYNFTIVTRFTNPTSSPIYFVRCNSSSRTPIFGVSLVGQTDAWGSAFNPVWACVGGGGQFIVAPGATRVDTLHLSGPNAWDTPTGAPLGIAEGPMRLSFDPQTCPADPHCVMNTDSLRLSNEFTVHIPR
ncbi:MAG: hypothetical protein ACREPM_18680 [Gemmatimonadaceae bacterium]